MIVMFVKLVGLRDNDRVKLLRLRLLDLWALGEFEDIWNPGQWARVMDFAVEAVRQKRKLCCERNNSSC